MSDPIRTLPETFRKKGFDFTILRREGDLALLRKRRPHWRPGTYSYEVLKIQRSKGGIIHGRVFPACEYLPSDEKWGIQGWTYTNEDDAIHALLMRIPCPGSHHGKEIEIFSSHVRNLAHPEVPSNLS